MKMLVIGSSKVVFPDKKTGEVHDAIVLDVAKNNVNYYGKATESFFIVDTSPLYAHVIEACKVSVQDLTGYFIDVDKNNKGYLDNIEFLEKSQDAVIWGF